MPPAPARVPLADVRMRARPRFAPEPHIVISCFSAPLPSQLSAILVSRTTIAPKELAPSPTVLTGHALLKLRIADAPGHRFRKHLGTDSGALGHRFRSTWAPIPDTWALIPEHLGTDSDAPGQPGAMRVSVPS
jgi:hypothetical protein